MKQGHMQATVKCWIAGFWSSIVGLVLAGRQGSQREGGGCAGPPARAQPL